MFVAQITRISTSRKMMRVNNLCDTTLAFDLVCLLCFYRDVFVDVMIIPDLDEEGGGDSDHRSKFPIIS